MTCLDSVVPLSAAILARQTKKAKIAIIGTPIVHRDNPVRVAEEIAMLDCVSRGRIISGFVRGVGSEIHPANTNPALQRERMDEAHDLIIKAWTEHEPFNWEGRFWHYRYVNVWPRVYQQPHPPIWVTGSHAESAEWVADRQYTFATLPPALRAGAEPGRRVQASLRGARLRGAGLGPFRLPGAVLHRRDGGRGGRGRQAAAVVPAARARPAVLQPAGLHALQRDGASATRPAPGARSATRSRRCARRASCSAARPT